MFDNLKDGYYIDLQVINMKLEDYFDCNSFDDIRIKGTRIGIESILYEYIYREQPAESIVKGFSSLSLEQVYATILYYLHNKEKIEKYLTDWLEYSQQMRAEQERNPPPIIIRLRVLKRKKPVTT